MSSNDPVRRRSRRSSTTKKNDPAECLICHGIAQNPLVLKAGKYHRDCYRMQQKGLLRAGYDKPSKDSTGEFCPGCNRPIMPGDKHAHRNGRPFHKECLFLGR